jgi:hypothetical protein
MSSSGLTRSNAASSPPGHDRQRALLHGRRAAGHRGVHPLHPALGQAGGALARVVRVRAAHVEHQRAGAQVRLELFEHRTG